MAEGRGSRGKTASVQLAKRYILCFVDDVCQFVVSAFFKLFCCLLQNYTKTIHVDEDGNVDDVDVSVGVGVALSVDFLKRKAKGEGSGQKQRR